MRTICFPFRVDTVDEGVRANIGGNSKCEVHDRVLQTVVTLFLISLWRRLTRSHFPVLLIFEDSVAGFVDVLTEVGEVNRNVILLKD